MKASHIIICAMAMFSIPTVSMAQDTTSPTKALSLAAAGGGNLSTFSGSVSGVNFNSKPGIQLGLHAEYPLSDKLSAKSGAYFITKGAAIKVSGIKATFGLTYVEVPLQLMYRVGDAFHLYGGPAVGVRTSAKVSFSSGNNPTDDVSGYGRIDAALAVGGIYRTPLLANKLAVDVSISQGITTINKDWDGSLRNRSFRTGLLFFFN